MAGLRVHICLGLMLGVEPVDLRSQAEPPGPQQLRAEWITVDEGLPQGMVRTIIEDRTGHLWFGTKDGLVRSDGNRLRVYRHDDADSTSLCGDHVTALLESRDGLLWIATEHDGISSYDPRTERFTRVRSVGSRALELAKAPRTLDEDPQGNIWVRGQLGELTVIIRSRPDERTNGSVAPLLRTPASVFPGLSLPDSVGCLLFTPDGRLWIADNTTLHIHHVPTRKDRDGPSWPVPASEMTHDPWDEPVSLILDTSRSRVLLMRGVTLIAFDANTGQPLDTIRLRVDAPIGGDRPLLDSHGRIWAATQPRREVVRIDPGTGILHHIRFEPENRAMFPETPFALCWTEDRNGNLWIGMGGFGVLKYRTITERIRRSRMGQFTSFIKADLAGRYILASENFALVDPAGESGHILPIGTALHEAGSMAGWRCVVVDPAGAQWCCMTSGGGRHSQLVRLGPEKNARLEIHSIDRNAQVCDVRPGQGDDLWVSLYGPDLNSLQGLIRYDTRTRQITGRYRFPRPLWIKEYRAISDWQIDNDGTVFMGALDGVYVLHPTDGRWEFFVHDPSAPQPLPRELILSICPDPAEPKVILWVGTEGGGLARLDLRSGQCTRYTTRQGLPNDVVYGIVPDPRGNLWLSTNSGLCRFDPRTSTVTHFTKEDGLCGNEFNRYSALRSYEGRLFFGGVDGVTSFDPEQLYLDHHPSPTLLTGLRLANKEVLAGSFMLPGSKMPVLPEAIQYLDKLVLPHDQRMITFMFACMDLSAPRKNTYRYRLEGFDMDWVESMYGAEATYTNLDPGTYRFRVQGRNSKGVLDEDGAAIMLIITQPWWATWWFRACVLLVITFLSYGIYRYRATERARLIQVRDRIARDLHDEIGSTLSSVALFSEIAKRHGTTSQDMTNQMLERIGESTSQMVESMNDIVWAVNSKNDDLLHVVQRMHEYAARMAEAGGITLNMTQEGIEPGSRLSMTQRKNLYLIFKEVINNAVKHSRCTDLTVGIISDLKQIRLYVEDNGIGMKGLKERERTEQGGNGLLNLHSRTKELRGHLCILDRAGGGTVITLRFPL